MEIGSKLKEARMRTDFTQEKVSEAIGVSRQTISNWENEKSYPDIVSVIKLSDLYDVSLDYLLKGKERTPMLSYIDYLEESTNTVKSKQKLTKMMQVGIYVVLWAACLIWFWLGQGSDGGFAMGYSLITFYFILPVATFVISILIGKDVAWGSWKYIMPFFFGAMYALENFGTFLLANNIACGNQNLPSIEDAVPGFVFSLLGLVMGLLIKRFRCKKHGLQEEAKFSDEKMKAFDCEENNEIIKKYASKKCSVDILKPLANIDDKKVQLILKEINNTILMYALAGASGKVCAIFMKNLSGRMLRFLDEQLQTEVLEEESIRAAQIHILQVASTLK